jgi:hypothetical protein
MKEEELIETLRRVKLPDIQLESHRRRLKVVILNSGYSRHKQEVTLLDMVKTQTTGVLGALSGALVVRRPVWKVSLTTIIAVLMLFAIWISIPQTSAVLKSALFPEGSRHISGPQLTAEEQGKAMTILMADSRVVQLLAQGAVIDKILHIQVEAQSLNPETGKVEIVRETWAQAWIVLDNKDFGVQVDLVRGQIVSITE